LVVWGLVSGCFAAVDEWTQQFVGRNTALDDFTADLIGVEAGLIVIVALGLVQWQYQGQPDDDRLPRDKARLGPPDQG